MNARSIWKVSSDPVDLLGFVSGQEGKAEFLASHKHLKKEILGKEVIMTLVFPSWAPEGPLANDKVVFFEKRKDVYD